MHQKWLLIRFLFVVLVCASLLSGSDVPLQNGTNLDLNTQNELKPVENENDIRTIFTDSNDKNVEAKESELSTGANTTEESLNPTNPENDSSVANNMTEDLGQTDCNKTNCSGPRTKKVTCLHRNETNTNLTVQIMDSMWTISIQSVPHNSSNGFCQAVLFYKTSCHFSAAAAPHYNALPRIFPDVLCIAIDSSTYSSLAARLGIIGLPTLMIFHGGYPIAKFNDSQYTLEKFAAFITRYTGLVPNGIPNVTSTDFEGPLSSIPTIEVDPFLWLAWIFVILCCGFGISKSSLFNRIVEALRNNWHEAEAQHQHAD